MLADELKSITENERVKSTSLKEHDGYAILSVTIFPPEFSLIDVSDLKLAFKIDPKRYPDVKPQVGVPGKPFCLKLRADIAASLTVFSQSSLSETPILDIVNYVVTRFDTLFLSNVSSLVPFESVANDGRTIKMFAPIPASANEDLERHAMKPIETMPIRSLSETLKYISSDFNSAAGINMKKLCLANPNHFSIESISPLTFFLAIPPSKRFLTQFKDMENRHFGFRISVPPSWEPLSDDEAINFFITRPSNCITIDLYLYDPIKQMKVPSPPVGSLSKDVLEAASNQISLQLNASNASNELDYEPMEIPDDIQSEYYQLCHDLIAINNSDYPMPNISLYVSNIENVISIVSLDPKKYVLQKTGQIFIDCDNKKRDRVSDYAVVSDIPKTENISSFQFKKLDLSVACRCGATFNSSTVNISPHRPVTLSRSCPSCDELCIGEYLPKIWTPFFNKKEDHFIEVLSESNVLTLAVNEDKCSVIVMCECSNSFEAPSSLLEKGGVVCDECGSRLTLKSDDILFYTASGQSTTSVAKIIGDVKPSFNIDKVTKKLVPGQPLPQFGTCKHYKKSKRAFRFRCCKGLYFACDICHEEYAEKNPSHGPNVYPLGSSIICGFCSQEFRAPKSLSEECICPRCGYNHAGKGTSTSFWSGGKGQRDQSKMSKNDKHKFRNLTKGSKQGTTRKGTHR